MNKKKSDDRIQKSIYPPNDTHKVIEGLAIEEKRSYANMAIILIEEALKARKLIK